MKSLWNRLSVAWCQVFHSRSSWPAHGRYYCLCCFRTYPVPWEEGDDFVRRQPVFGSRPRLRGFMVFEFPKYRD